jgi:hypothetical protein
MVYNKRKRRGEMDAVKANKGERNIYIHYLLAYVAADYILLSKTSAECYRSGEWTSGVRIDDWLNINARLARPRP